ncbi:MAG: hypothetical protein J7480_04680 [Microbacteriaceae bacterium]|nr:hypothetical protein [Microbacteriaceae bacterium]
MGLQAAIGVGAALAAAVAGTLGLAGCTGAGGENAPGAPAALPDGVTVDVYQTRTDLPARRLEIAVANAGTEALTVTSAELVSAQFAGPAVWHARPGGTVVHAGFAVDLPVELPGPACDDPAPAAAVRLGFTTADGATGTAELPAVDRYDRLPDMRAEECFGVAVAKVAAMTIDGPVRVGEVDGAPTAFVAVAIEPTGAEDAFTIDALEDTVLLALRSPDGAAAESLPLGLRVAGTDAPSVLEIPIAPARCDAHAVAEDKQGTIFLLEATAPDGAAGLVRIAAAPEARASIYAFYAQACGLPAPVG